MFIRSFVHSFPSSYLQTDLDLVEMENVKKQKNSSNPYSRPNAVRINGDEGQRKITKKNGNYHSSDTDESTPLLRSKEKAEKLNRTPEQCSSTDYTEVEFKPSSNDSSIDTLGSTQHNKQNNGNINEIKRNDDIGRNDENKSSEQKLFKSKREMLVLLAMSLVIFSVTCCESILAPFYAPEVFNTLYFIL